MGAQASGFSIDRFTAKLKDGGALASLFQAEITKSGGTMGKVEDFSFLCKAANFPTSALSETTLTYMGRPFRIPGNRDPQDWTTTIYNDENFEIRNHLENWMERINSQRSNVRTSGLNKINSYTGTLKIHQLMKTDYESRTKSYEFVECWPMTLAEITTDWETNEIQTYDVTWAFSYWKSTQSGAGA